MDITTVYQKERRDFGRPTVGFTATDVEVLDEFEQDPVMLSSHIERNPTSLDVQAIPERSEAYVRAAPPAMRPPCLTERPSCSSPRLPFSP